MGSIDTTLQQLNQLDSLGERLLTDQDIDFNAYSMDEEEGHKVKPAIDFYEQVSEYMLDPVSQQGLTLPWKQTHGCVGLRPGELSIWAGVNGHGKSMLLSHVMLHCQRQGARICIASMEMKPVQTLARMTRQGTGGAMPRTDLIQKFLDSLQGFYLYDQQGTVQQNRMLAVVRFCRERLGVTHFVIDSLMKCGMGTDDYTAQKNFVDKLSTYAKDHNIHIHLVAHSRKTENEFKQMGKFDVKGAGEITDMADNVFTVWRNKKKEEKIEAGTASDDERAMPDCVLRCDKQRHGEWEGKVGLWFNPQAMQYVSKNTRQVFDYLG